MVVYDVTDRESFEEAKMHISRLSYSKAQNLTKALVGAKIDMEYKRAVLFEDGLVFALKYDWIFGEVSSKQGLAISEIFSLVISEHLAITNSSVQNLDPVQSQNLIPIQKFGPSCTMSPNKTMDFGIQGNIEQIRFKANRNDFHKSDRINEKEANYTNIKSSLDDRNILSKSDDIKSVKLKRIIEHTESYPETRTCNMWYT